MSYGQYSYLLYIDTTEYKGVPLEIKDLQITVKWKTIAKNNREATHMKVLP